MLFACLDSTLGSFMRFRFVCMVCFRGVCDLVLGCGGCDCGCYFGVCWFDIDCGCCLVVVGVLLCSCFGHVDC